METVSVFPSGNIITVSHDKSIEIYDESFNILQIIENAHDGYIYYVDIKDENNFITCSEKDFKIWIKDKNGFILNKCIENAHTNSITKILYCSNGDIISCSRDKTVKIWKKNENNNYKVNAILYHNNKVYSILILENKKI